MKVIISFIIGVSITFGAVVLFDYLHPSDRDLLVYLTIENDTGTQVELVTVKSDNGQSFSCTLHFNKCSLGIKTGDATFRVLATMDSGEMRAGSIGYLAPGAGLDVLISYLEPESSLIRPRFND